MDTSPLDIPSGRSSSVPYGQGEIVGGERLAAVDADRGFAEFVLVRAGLDAELRDVQAWRLATGTVEALVEVADDGRWRVRVQGHEAPAPLAVVYSASVSGEFHWLGGAEFPRWKRRAMLEAGLLAPPAIYLAALPEHASDPTRALWGAIELLVRVRALGGEASTEPLPLSRPFLMRWAAMGERAVRSGMEALEEEQFVWRVGSHGRMNLWRVLLAGEERVATTGDTR